MTLCIAALCLDYDSTDEEDNGYRVVLSFDRRIETDVVSADTEFRITTLSDSWKALLAGPTRECRRLADLYSERLSQGGITLDNVLDVLHEPAQKHRRALADRYVQKVAAISHQEFLENASTQFSPEFHRQVELEIAAQRIAAELILIGNVGGNLLIFVCRDGEVYQAREFAAIGSGAMIAEIALYQRAQKHIDDFPTTEYCVFEAAILGSTAPGVGQDARLMVASPDGKDKDRLNVDFVENNTIAALRKAYEAYGPKPLPGDFALDVLTEKPAAGAGTKVGS